MKLVSHAQQEVLGRFELDDIVGANNALYGKTIEILRARLYPADPSGRMDIAETALAILHVRLQKIDRSAIAFMAQSIFRQFFLDESMDPLFDQAVLDCLVKLLVELVMT